MRKVFINKRNNKYYLSWVYDKNAGVLPVDDISGAEQSPEGIVVVGRGGETKRIPVADKKYFNMFTDALSQVGRKNFSLIEKLVILFFILIALGVLFFMGVTYGAKQVVSVYSRLLNPTHQTSLSGLNNLRLPLHEKNLNSPQSKPASIPPKNIVPPSVKNNLLPPADSGTAAKSQTVPSGLLPPGM